jgi:hypothetical protein
MGRTFVFRIYAVDESVRGGQATGPAGQNLGSCGWRSELPLAKKAKDF